MKEREQNLFIFSKHLSVECILTKSKNLFYNFKRLSGKYILKKSPNLNKKEIIYLDLHTSNVCQIYSNLY